MKTKRIFLIIISILGTLLIGAILLAACAPKDKDFKTEQDWAAEVCAKKVYDKLVTSKGYDKSEDVYPDGNIQSQKINVTTVHNDKNCTDYIYSAVTTFCVVYEGNLSGGYLSHCYILVCVKQKPKSFKTKLYNFLQGNKKVQRSELQIEILYVM